MSNITQRYDENFLGVPQQTKNVDSTRKHQTKKQIFGEIKNVIHNQGLATPLKQHQGNKNTSSNYLLCASVKNKNSLKNENNHKCQILKSVYNSHFNETNLISFDFRGQCCSEPYKSDQQIWSEMNLYDDSFINKILDDDKVEESICDESIEKVIDENPEFFNDLQDGPKYNYWPLTEEFREEPDIHLLLEKPLIDFNF